MFGFPVDLADNGVHCAGLHLPAFARESAQHAADAMIVFSRQIAKFFTVPFDSYGEFVVGVFGLGDEGELVAATEAVDNFRAVVVAVAAHGAGLQKGCGVRELIGRPGGRGRSRHFHENEKWREGDQFQHGAAFHGE